MSYGLDYVIERHMSRVRVLTAALRYVTNMSGYVGCEDEIEDVAARALGLSTRELWEQNYDSDPDDLLKEFEDALAKETK